jgi:pimeloyl-ACP methyl ester carboxylesterase
MKQKLIFTNSNSTKLVGILSNPRNTTTVPMMILCHGFTSSKESSTYLALEKLFNEKNIATFRFDFFGHGESGGKFEEISVTEGMDDILCALAFLKKQGYKKIGLFGSSYGGFTAILAAARTNSLFVLELKCPVSDDFGKRMATLTKTKAEEWKKKGWTYYVSSDGRKHKLNYSFFSDPNNTAGYEAAQKIKIPTIIIHGDADTVVPLEESKRLALCIKDSKLVILPGCRHHFEGEDFERSNKAFVQFVEEQL